MIDDRTLIEGHELLVSRGFDDSPNPFVKRMGPSCRVPVMVDGMKVLTTGCLDEQHALGLGLDGTGVAIVRNLYMMVGKDMT